MESPIYIETDEEDNHEVITLSDDDEGGGEHQETCKEKMDLVLEKLETTLHILRDISRWVLAAVNCNSGISVEVSSAK